MSSTIHVLVKCVGEVMLPEKYYVVFLLNTNVSKLDSFILQKKLLILVPIARSKDRN